ncbi:hypothetical protein L2E82_11208 [Cichorium intybus]|uniref:Uncharacterized protein n=1 Tax=Cichorium intybus TaxID=13427 RepID=A0ACB9GDN6_CICIN|nr:hypothetical protein L2E82_11208 [Cichorium intybus]
MVPVQMTQPAVQLASIDEDNSLSQHKQQEIKISVASQHVHSKPCPDLLNECDFYELMLRLGDSQEMCLYVPS